MYLPALVDALRSLHERLKGDMEAVFVLDGVVDGVIENPRACPFDYASLQCKGGDDANCLTAAQVQTAIPTIETAGLRGGTRYYDGQFDDARLAVLLDPIAVVGDRITGEGRGALLFCRGCAARAAAPGVDAAVVRCLAGQRRDWRAVVEALQIDLQERAQRVA